MKAAKKNPPPPDKNTSMGLAGDKNNSMGKLADNSVTNKGAAKEISDSVANSNNNQQQA